MLIKASFTSAQNPHAGQVFKDSLCWIVWGFTRIFTRALVFFSCGNPRYSHMRIHDNDLDLCQYCPYRYEKPSNYTTHLKKHFGIEDFVCDHCDKKFPTVTQLNMHHEQHEGIIYYCLICNEYEGQGSTHRLVRGPLLGLTCLGA